MKRLVVSLVLGACLAAPSLAASAKEKPAKIKVNPRSGIAGSTFVASGSVARGASGARILWNDGTISHTLAEAIAGATGKFTVTCSVPANASTGLVQVCVTTSGPGRLGTDLGCTPFLVLPTPPGRINGQVTTTNELGGIVHLAGATVLVKTADGGIAYTNDNTGAQFAVGPLVTDTDGNFNVPGLAPGNYLIEINQDGYFAEPSNFIVPSGGGGNVLVPVFPNISDSKITFVGAIALNTGALSALSTPIIVSSQNEAKSSGIICRFGSLPGVGGIAEVRVRFWADAVFPTSSSPSERAVQFEVFDGGNVLWDVTKPSKGLVHPAVPVGEAYHSAIILADMNVSEFPAGLLTLRVTPLVNGAPGVFKDYSIQMVDLKTRWFPCWLNGQQLQVSGGSSSVRYDLTAYAPSPTPNLLVNLPIDLVIETFQNQVSANAEIHERYETGKGFIQPFQKSKLTSIVKLMSTDIVNGTWPYSAKFKPDGTVDSYKISPFTAAGPMQFTKFKIYQNGPGIGCVPACVLDCDVCAGWKVWVDFKLSGSLDVSSTIDSDLSLDVDITPFVSGTLGGHVRAELVICSLSANVTGTADIGLPFHYESAPCPGEAGFENPCVRLSAHADADFSCLDIGIGGGGDIGPYTFGDCPAAASLQPKLLVAALSDQDHVDESPAVAANGQGGAMALWVQTEPAYTDALHRLVYYSRFDDGAWSEGQPVSPVPALVNHPSVAFVGVNSAFALWAQNHRTPEQIFEDGGAQLANQDIYFSTWDGNNWAAAQPVTEDNFAEGFPHVAADPISERLLAVWTRSMTDEPDAAPEDKFFTIVYSVFTGGAWSAPLPIAPSSPSMDYQASLTFDHDGNAWVVWTRDVDGDLTTFADRALLLSMWDGATWSAPETIPGTPDGAFSPSLALDSLNQPLVAFTEPPTDTDGNLTSGVSNRNQLWAAYRSGRGWEVAPVGDPFYAEEPVVVVNSQNQAVLMFRRFADDVSIHRDGDLAAAVADLNAEALNWTADWLTDDGQTNWKTTFAVDPNSAMNFVLNVKLPAVQLPDVAANAPVLAMMTFSNTPDLAIEAGDIMVSEAFPAVGDAISLFATVHNRGLGPVPAGSAFTVTFYDGDPAKGTNKLGKVIGTRTVNGPLRYGDSAQVSVPFLLQRGGRHIITVVVQPGRGLMDQKAANNTARMTLGVPFSPTNLAAASDSASQQIALLWDTPFNPNPLRYRVFRSTTPGSGYEMIGDTTGTTFVDLRVAADMTYYYVVAAVDEFGVLSQFSNEATGELSAVR